MKKLGLFVVLGAALGYLIFRSNKPAAPKVVNADTPPIRTQARVQEATNLPSPPPIRPDATESGRPATARRVGTKTEAVLSEANTLWNTGRGEEGLRILKKALEQDPNNSELLTQVGVMQMDLYDEPGASLQYFTQAAQADPNNADALTALVELHARSGTLHEAEAFLRELPEDSQARMALADIALRQGAPERALENIENHPEAQTDLVLAATANLNSGRHEEAIELFHKNADQQRAQYEKSHSKADAKMYSLAQTELANAHLQAGSLEEAMREARRAVQLDPHNGYARKLIGQIRKQAN